MTGFSSQESAEIIGFTHSMMRQLKFQGLKPAGPGGKWSEHQVLALAVRTHARRSGGSKLACDAAFRLLCFADLGRLRSGCQEGKRFLRLFGDVCDTNLVSEKSAFDPSVLKAATESRTQYVVADVAFWLDKIDEAKRDQIPRNQEKNVSANDVLHAAADCGNAQGRPREGRRLA